MIVVVFEVTVKPDVGQRYFDLAARLRTVLESIDGFISVERFESLSAPGKYVSISFWRDEAAVACWRADEEHALAQERGKQEVFADFRISVGQVVRQYTMADRTGGDTP